MDYKQRLDTMISALVAQGASDLHLSVGSQPIIRVSGSLTALLTEASLTAEDMKAFIAILLSPQLLARFTEKQEVDFSYTFGNVARFRGNGYVDRGNISVALRLIPRIIRTLAELNLPQVLETFTTREQGFFLVVGLSGRARPLRLPRSSRRSIWSAPSI